MKPNIVRLVMNKSIQWTREGPEKIGTILIKSEHLRRSVQRILRSADENQPPSRLIERAAPDVRRHLAAGTGAVIECDRLRASDCYDLRRGGQQADPEKFGTRPGVGRLPGDSNLSA